MKGYKGFKPDWTCRGFQYKVGETYELEGELSLCENGFHFCKTLAEVFNFYDDDCVYAEIEALGDIIEGEDKCVTNKIKILRQVPQEEVLNLVNYGYGNTGRMNFGNNNSGYNNHGYNNLGSSNFGNENVGSANFGKNNYGDDNFGSDNFGDSNYGYTNVGSNNYGDKNLGSKNYGHRNAGSLNFGNNNSGNNNYGDLNIGSYNYGIGNTGNCNFGDFNLCNGVIGCFNTENFRNGTQFFNKLCYKNMIDWINSKARKILQTAPLERDERTNWWDNLSEIDKKVIYKIPNFDIKMFLAIMGIEEDSTDIWKIYFKNFENFFSLKVDDDDKRKKTNYDFDNGEAFATLTYKEKNGDREFTFKLNYSRNCCTLYTDGKMVSGSSIPITEKFFKRKLMGLAWFNYLESYYENKENEKFIDYFDAMYV